MTDRRKPKFKELHEKAQEKLSEPLNRWLTIHLCLAGFKEGRATESTVLLVVYLMGDIRAETTAQSRKRTTPSTNTRHAERSNSTRTNISTKTKGRGTNTKISRPTRTTKSATNIF